MTSIALLVMAIAVLPTFGLAAWVWLAMASETDDSRSFAGFEDMHFED